MAAIVSLPMVPLSGGSSQAAAGEQLIASKVRTSCHLAVMGASLGYSAIFHIAAVTQGAIFFAIMLPPRDQEQRPTTLSANSRLMHRSKQLTSSACATSMAIRGNPPSRPRLSAAFHRTTALPLVSGHSRIAA